MMNEQGSNNMLGAIFGSIGAAGFVEVAMHTILLSTIGAVVGGVVGFLVNRWLKKLFVMLDKKKIYEKNKDTGK